MPTTQSLASWLMKSTWDKRQRAERYRDHVVRDSYDDGSGNVVSGVGYQQTFKNAVRNDERSPFTTNVPGFRRDEAHALSRNKLDNNEWPIDFAPSYANGVGVETQSWRTRLQKWKKPAVPMIANIKANPGMGLMQVTFASDGAIVLYDHVPREVIYELSYAARNGSSVGSLFWSVVRYRGTKVGSKYPWTVQQGGTPVAQREERQMSPEERNWVIKKTEQALNSINIDEIALGESPEQAERLRRLYWKLSDAYEGDDYHVMNKTFLEGRNVGLW